MDGWRAMLATALLTSTASAQPADPPGQAPLTVGAHQTIINDLRFWYRVAGRTDGVPIVFLHGGPGQGSQSFASLVGPKLEPSLRMVYLDQRGSGRSERPWDKAYSLDLVVDDLEKLRQAWGVPKIGIIGHSIGTLLAMEYGARYPERVAKMVLAASGPDMPAAFNAQCDRLARLNPAAYARALGDAERGSNIRCNMYAGALGKEQQAFVNANMFPDLSVSKTVEREDSANGLRNTGEYSRALINGGVLEYRFDRHARLAMPVLVIAGEKDFQTGVGPQRTFAERLPEGRFLEYKEAGHFMFVEQTPRFARDVIAFFRDGGSRLLTKCLIA